MKDYRALAEQYNQEFYEIFGAYPNIHPILGFWNVGWFDKHIETPDGVSTKEHIRQKYGERALEIVEAIL